MAEVATTKLFENDKIIVWEMILEPGESTGVHTHEHEYLFYALEGATLKATDADGNEVETLEVPAGSVYHLELQGDELVMGDLRFPTTHDAINVGETRYREILVEIK